MAQQALDLNVPDEAFGPGETRPWQVMLEIEKVSRRREGVIQASGGAAPAEPRYPVAQGLYDPAADHTKNVQASSSESRLVRGTNAAASPGMRLYDEGLKALETQDREGALAKFQEAWKFQDQLDPAIRQQLKDKLTFLRAATVQPPVAGTQPSPLEQVNSQQEIMRQKMYREIISEEKAAKELAQRDPRTALVNLTKLRDRVSAADVEPASKKQLLTIVDRMVNELSSYIEQNKATIENDERNAAVRTEVVRSQELTIETQNKLADMVERFNKLMDERRFPEAEVIAMQARDIDPQNVMVVNMIEKSRLGRNIAEQYALKEAKENAFTRTLADVDRAANQNVGDENPLVFDAKRWGDLTKSRRGILGEGRKLSPAEQEIQKSLSKLVEAKFNERPLGEVLETLSKMVGVNIHLDPQGLAAEGLTTDVPVSLNLAQPISLRSALNLLLENKGLSYVIQNEVLLVTSAQNRDRNTHFQVYYVADLVMPIPNFVPGYNVGLPAALRESLSSLGYGGPARPMFTGPLTIAQNEEQKVKTGAVPASVLAQMGAAGMQTENGVRIPNGGAGLNHGPGGPGGMGGGVVADFDALIDLIQTTIAPESWVDVGGPGSIMEFASNLSLVVSQTQDVHEQIADLLQQLRRLQDLQVTIEVRFITLSDRFFERIGVDFDFRIDDNTHLTNQIDQLPANSAAGIVGAPVNSFFDDDNYSIGIGWTATGPTADLDVAFDQGSFGSTAPQFGNFDANSAANFGFAILSDIEAFFLLQAAQGDDRTNILQAPKVTLFNGQSANVNDQVTRPFVTSVIPVVGDFAAAYQPVIVVLNEGTALNVQAVVSADRRFVRLTLVPFFSQIGDVDTFTFNGRVTTDSGTVVQDPSDPDNTVTNGQTKTIEGTTVQLPTFAFTSVTTTVSVPDGGTVLLGGVKRLREGRNERGVPLLSKVPYISRLFKNVGIGRDAQSLMMMVTPRIIIQEEEEQKLGIEVAEP
jgi:general secretion pathway protein D